jgi:hypothetical protein
MRLATGATPAVRGGAISRPVGRDQDYGARNGADRVYVALELDQRIHVMGSQRDVRPGPEPEFGRILDALRRARQQGTGPGLVNASSPGPPPRSYLAETRITETETTPPLPKTAQPGAARSVDRGRNSGPHTPDWLALRW